MPLMNKKPCLPRGSSIQALDSSVLGERGGAEPVLGVVASAMASSGPWRAPAPPPVRDLLRQTLLPLALRKTVGSKKKPGRSRRRRRSELAPCSRAARPASRCLEDLLEASGPTSWVVLRVPIFSARIRSTNASRTPGDLLVMMNRLAAMQLWPAF